MKIQSNFYKSCIYCVFLFVGIFFSNNASAQRFRYTISGYIHEKGSGEPLGGIRVLAMRADKDIPGNSTDDKSFVTTSNSYGFYSLSLKNFPKGWNLYVRVTGYKDDSLFWSGIKDTSVNFNLDSRVDVELMEEVKITAKRNTIADKTEMSRVDVPVSQIKDIPALLGEKDVLKVIQLLPGVQKGSEGQSGIYVRGGGPDQNLLILDEAMVYNAGHLFGFFSIFNGDALKSVELIKGGFPAKYGGRLSSVIDLTMKDGNKERVTGEVGIGLIAGRFMVEGPLKKNKSSFMISGRRTYLDLLAAPIIMAANNGSMAGYYFYDMNMKLNYTLSNKDKLYLSGYFGRDNFYADFQSNPNEKVSTSYGWGNRTLTGRWNHQFTPKLFSNLSIIHSHYDLSLLATVTYHNQNSYLRYSSSINDYGTKYDFDFRPLPNHNVRFGLSSILHYFAPSALLLKENNKAIFDKSVNEVKSLESGIYIEDYIKIDKFGFFPGFRLSHYLIDNKQQYNPEPRVSVSFNQSKTLAFKASYASMNQYVMLLSNSRSSLPTDLWIPATQNIKPIKSQQVAIGVAKDLPNGLNFSVEAYYKTMQNVELLKDGESAIDFGALDPSATQNARNWEKKLTSGIAWSKGVELFLQKKTGKLSGWIGYTLSYTQMQFDQINDGKPFWAKYDRRHDISIVAIYKITKELSFAATWVYGTGNAVNIERGYINTSSYTFTANPYLWNPMFQTVGLNRNIDYGSRNSFRMEPYHRLDLALRLSKPTRKGIQTWEFGAYNAYNRANPFFYYGSQNDFGVVSLKKVSIFPLIPSVSWNFKFN